MNKVKRKDSLATFVSIAFVFIVALSIFSAVLSYHRLNNFNHILSEITEKSLPESSLSSQINSALKEVLYLAEKLTNASNEPSRRIAYESLLKQEKKLSQLTRSFEDSIYFNNQINMAKNEINDLNHLVKKRIRIEKLLFNKIDEAYLIQNHLIEKLNNKIESFEEKEHIKMRIIKSVALGHKALNLYRLQPVRQLAKKSDDNLNNVQRFISKESEKLSDVLTKDVNQLQHILSSETGLFNLKVEQLQISGRTRGQGNFLHHLIVDISRLTETRFYKINKVIVNESQKTTQEIAEQIKWSILLAVSVILLLIATVLFINKRVVARILSLNDSVLQLIQSNDAQINIKGNDEIGYLARSFIYFTEKIEVQKQQLEQLSLTDSLTGLPNRRSMDKRLNHDIHTAKRGHLPLSLIMMDIDFFKKYNDFYGHVAGDECLKNVALALRKIQLRESDFIARYGGEEFVMLLPTTDKQGALQIAERIKSALIEFQLPHIKSEVSQYVTLSMGIATFTEDEIFTVDNVINTADKALYYAKNKGRNLYAHADDMKE